MKAIVKDPEIRDEIVTDLDELNLPGPSQADSSPRLMDPT